MRVLEGVRVRVRVTEPVLDDVILTEGERVRLGVCVGVLVRLAVCVGVLDRVPDAVLEGD